MIILFVFTTSCTDLSEDLKLHDKLQKEQVKTTENPSKVSFDTGGTTGDGGNDTDGSKGN